MMNGAGDSNSKPRVYGNSEPLTCNQEDQSTKIDIDSGHNTIRGRSNNHVGLKANRSYGVHAHMPKRHASKHIFRCGNTCGIISAESCIKQLASREAIFAASHQVGPTLVI